MMDAGPGLLIAGVPVADAATAAITLFARIGACLMLMPGLSSPQIPMQIRLYIALGLTLVLAPLLFVEAAAAISGLRPITLMRLLLAESAVGAAIGFMGRLFFLMLQFAGTATATMLGFAPVPGAVMDPSEPTPAFTSMILLSVSALFFVTGQHWEVTGALAGSYAVVPVGALFEADVHMQRIVTVATQASLLALQVCGPFLVFGLLINHIFGILNKFAPQVPVFFLSTAFSIAGALLLLLASSSNIASIFIGGFASWLRGE
jgi:flagellar biosynthetic protein FliR